MSCSPFLGGGPGVVGGLKNSVKQWQLVLLVDGMPCQGENIKRQWQKTIAAKTWQTSRILEFKSCI
jgi:hypothetical protein